VWLLHTRHTCLNMPPKSHNAGPCDVRSRCCCVPVEGIGHGIMLPLSSNLWPTVGIILLRAQFTPADCYQTCHGFLWQLWLGIGLGKLSHSIPSCYTSIGHVLGQGACRTCGSLMLPYRGDVVVQCILQGFLRRVVLYLPFSMVDFLLAAFLYLFWRF